MSIYLCVYEYGVHKTNTYTQQSFDEDPEIFAKLKEILTSRDKVEMGDTMKFTEAIRDYAQSVSTRMHLLYLC